MKKTGKLILCALLACGVVCSLAACGGETPQQPADTAVVSSAVEQTPEETGPTVYEDFTSGVLYDEGEYYFAIDSMERTEEGLVITYRADSDLDGRHIRRAELGLPLKINGVDIACLQEIDEELFRMEHEGEMLTQSFPYITGRDKTAQMVISEDVLEALNIEGVPTVSMGMSLGSVRQDSQGDFHTGVSFEFTLAPGAVVDSVDFPTPKDESWVLLDDEGFGKVQIVTMKEDKTRRVAEGYVLTEPGNSEETGVRMDSNFMGWDSIWPGDAGEVKSLQYLSFALGDDPDAPKYYKPTLELELSNNGGLDELKVYKHTLNLTGLEEVKE